ncbi:SusD/RagB family nutrient-binding outer membrane lipoprotein [Emticicia sp. 21SJ11W-3]|uniref:SusD/RagB family nutrient-binding outer membrane lipoprotein n=1 Tax=Emticicia sp. 21SJ11W-3 TaxID=2916755 RepID=UPI0020A0069E|nr:SusD/RagB family nutrient-binding outer membrane lipoprotein [Emticicia sp. 21SJ11W-3]UTA69530.1 SusD/RagB family nutrient-binding outer membrane lipoprotein [Emticicia sp. 21SJ11W-3]
MTILSGCQSFLDVNVDPTLKSDATVQELLSTAQLYTSEASYQQAYVAAQYAQQLGSNLGTNGTDAYYEAENASGWSNLYLYVIPQLNLIIKKGQEQNSPAYVGIAKTMLAYNLGLATSNWENIPYTQADQKNFSPAYDTQQSLYATIQKLLDEAIAELVKDAGTKPGSDDMIYKGDMGKWSRLAYSLKARYAMHQSAINPQTASQTALAALQNAMTSNADDFQLQYNSKNLSPWYSRVALANSTGNLSVTYGSTFVNLMNGAVQGIVDPRLPIVVTRKNGQTAYSGVVPGSGAGSTVDFNITAWHSNINSPIVMMTYAEVKAIEAEARFLANGGSISSTGTTTDAYNAYLAIARANMQKLGVSSANIDTYLSAPVVNVGAANLTLTHIIREKYKAMFLIGDIWTDVRKYNYLDFPMPLNLNPDLNGQRIQRMKYPSSELTRNAKNAEANLKQPGVKMWLFNK